MVKNWKNATMAALMLTLALGSGGAASAETTDGQNTAAETKAIAAVKATDAPQKVGIVHFSTFGSLLNGPVHEQQYLKLLVKAYAPETEAEWTAAIDERKQVESKLVKPMVVKATPMEGGQESAEGKTSVFYSTKLDTITAVPAEKLEAASDSAAEGTTDQNVKPIKIKRIVLPKDGEAIHDIIQKDMKELPAEVKLNLEFTKAVEAGDSAQLKALLPQLLEQYKQQTIELKKLADAQAAEQSSNGNEENK